MAEQPPPGTETVLILDFGSQTAQLIARRVREAGVFSLLVSPTISVAEIRRLAPKGIILSGGPASVFEKGAPTCDRAIFELGIPVLGICYGMQLMSHLLGGHVQSANHREYGRARIDVRDGGDLFAGVDAHATVWMSHGDQVTQVPAGFEVLASTGTCPFAAVRDRSRRFYGVQFHPEVTHTQQGRVILERFVLGIAGVRPDWIMRDHIAEAVAAIRAQVGDERVVLGLSGGVDSSVAAALIHRAIGDRLTCVFVDHGLLRLDEGRMVMDMFSGRLHARVVHVDASAQFLGALAGVADPEAKRKIIGREFVAVFQREAAKLADARWLAQGTIYPDVVESGGTRTRKAVAIKSHHNVGGLPEKLGLKLLEPLRDLFKDEVRELGLALGLPREMVYRHPFPGPGLGVRILGEIRAEHVRLLQRADAIFIEELRATVDPEDGRDWYEKTSQAFAVFLPVKSVGVMGDGRTYDHVVALRAVVTSDFMTADAAELPYALLKRVAARIINEVKGINRVVYDTTSKPPGTIEWE